MKNVVLNAEQIIKLRFNIKEASCMDGCDSNGRSTYCGVWINASITQPFM